MFLKKLLASHSLQPSDYDLISIGGTAERYAALKTGAIAATLLTQPVDFQAQDDGLRRLGDIVRGGAGLPVRDDDRPPRLGRAESPSWCASSRLFARPTAGCTRRRTRGGR